MIQTKVIIIAATLNTIRYSIYLPRCLTGDEIGASTFGPMLRPTQPGHGWPQRSQLQPACASLSRTANSSIAFSFNISLTVSGSSRNKKVGFIESLLVRLKAMVLVMARLCVYWVLLCKNCVAACG